jgi:hypothetical protein
MRGVTTETAPMEVGAGVTVTARGFSGKGKAELLPVGGEYGMLAVCSGDDGCHWLSRRCLLSFAVCWKMARDSTLKTIGVRMLLQRMRRQIVK